MEKKLLKVKEVVLITGYCRSNVYAAIKSGELPAIRRGRSVRVSVGDLETWIERIKGEQGDE